MTKYGKQTKWSFRWLKSDKAIHLVCENFDLQGDSTFLLVVGFFGRRIRIAADSNYTTFMPEFSWRCLK